MKLNEIKNSLKRIFCKSCIDKISILEHKLDVSKRALLIAARDVEKLIKGDIYKPFK